jgi:hypothetical protein
MRAFYYWVLVPSAIMASTRLVEWVMHLLQAPKPVLF